MVCDVRLIVTRVYQLIEHERRAMLKEFGESVTAVRRMHDVDADVDADIVLLVETAKLTDNSFYKKLGSSCVNW